MADARKIIKKVGGSKRGSTRRSSSTRKESRVMPTWKYVTIAFLITVGVLALAYRPIIKSAFHRFTHGTNCSGHKIYGTCIPKGYSIYGIDISHHQGDIDWKELKKGKQGEPPITFIYIKATEGGSHCDTKFTKNWKAAQKHGFMRGAYHYFSAKTPGDKQARMFINKVRLEPGDLPPMVDVEESPKNVTAYRNELKKFITLIENHYGVRPIIYTYKKFHYRYIDNYFEEYPLWIARYEVSHPGIEDEWVMWQCTEKGRLPGIKEWVDINVLNGKMEELEKLRIK